jgi:hypothetical protein
MDILGRDLHLRDSSNILAVKCEVEMGGVQKITGGRGLITAKHDRGTVEERGVVKYDVSADVPILKLHSDIWTLQLLQFGIRNCALLTEKKSKLRRFLS